MNPQINSMNEHCSTSTNYIVEQSHLVGKTTDGVVTEDTGINEKTTEDVNLIINRDLYSTVATFIAGGVAGAVSRTSTAPLDRIKIIVQEGYLVQAPENTKLTSRKNAKLIEVIRVIYADGGYRAFWRGNMVNCFKAGPEFAMVFSLRRYFFSLYEDCVEREKQRLRAATQRMEAKQKRDREISNSERAEREAMTGMSENGLQDEVELTDAMKAEHAEGMRLIEREASIFTPPFNVLGCLSNFPRLAVNCTIGAAAGVGAQSILYPMEVVKTRVCVSKSSEFKGGVREVVRSAYRSGGIREFYRGFTPNMVGIIFYRGIEMGIYSSAQQSIMLYRMQLQNLTRHDAMLNSAEVGAVAMVSSFIAQTFTYPLNVVRTRLQTQGTNGREKRYNGMIDCTVKIIRTKGVATLFSGLLPNYLKAVPASTIAFVVFEKMQQLLLGDD